MKKIITLLLACIIVCAITVPCLADEVRTMTMTVSNSTVNVGDTITVTVGVSEVANCTSIGLGISFDADAFEMIKNAEGTYITTSLECEQATCEYNAIAGCYVAKIQMKQAQTISGNLFTFQLKVKDGANANKDYSISGIPSIRTSNGSISGNVKAANVSVACTHKYDNDCDTSCNLCGATRSIEHKYASKVTKEATCTAEGTKTYTCSVCGATKTESIPKKDHSYDKGKVTTAATCTAEGVKTYTCTCGATKTESVPKKDHDYKSEVTTEATCTAEGVKTVTCTACGKSYTDSIKKKDHDYKSEVTIEATCTTEGVKTVTCSVCGASYTDVIAKLSHEYDHDCDPDCNLCGEERTTEHLYSQRWSFDETGHWHACTVCNEVLELIPHTPGPEPTEETDQICLDCGYVLQLAGTHTHAEVGDWLSDDVNHWHLCSCGEILGQEAHSWQVSVRDEEEGVQIYVCTICGYPKVEEFEPTRPSEPETTPSTAPSQPQETKPSIQPTEPTQEPSGPNDGSFPWWIVLLAVGVLLIAAVVFVIVGILRSRKQTGKYSS